MTTAVKVRIGVAGLGFGAAVHIPAFQSIPGVEVTAIAGSTLSRTREVAEKYGIGIACASAVELTDLELDALSIALPPDKNEEVLTPALTQGLAVLCEKPLAVDLAAAERIDRLARGQITVMNFQFAELAVFRTLRELIHSKRFGQVKHVNVVWLTESYAHRTQTWSWKTDAQRGGGVLNLFGSHLLYLAEHLFGDIATVAAFKDSRSTVDFSPPYGKAAEDLVHLRLEFTQGAVLHATLGNANPGISTHRWHVVFEGASAIVDNPTRDYMAGFTLSLHSDKAPMVPMISDPPLEGDGRLPPFKRLAGRFIDSVRSRSPVQPDIAAGLRVQVLLDAARRSGGLVSECPVRDGWSHGSVRTI